MKKLAWKILVLGLAAVLIPAAIVNWKAKPIPDLPPPDPALEIHLPGGATAPLGDLVQEKHLPQEKHLSRAKGAEAGAPTLLQLGISALDLGRTDEALALLRSIPEDDPDYAAAQRHIGWKIYARALHRPEEGVAWVNRGLAHDPLKGNAWQDLCRIYLETLGL